AIQAQNDLINALKPPAGGSGHSLGVGGGIALGSIAEPLIEHLLTGPVLNHPFLTGALGAIPLALHGIYSGAGRPLANAGVNALAATRNVGALTPLAAQIAARR